MLNFMLNAPTLNVEGSFLVMIIAGDNPGDIIST